MARYSRIGIVPNDPTSEGLDDSADRGLTIAVFGAAGVGKTCLIQRLISGDFRKRHEPTAEDVYSRNRNGPSGPSKLSVIDSGGGETFSAMCKKAVARADAFMLVFAIDSESSLAYLEQVVAELRATRHRHAEYPPPPMILVGNKADLPSAARKVKTDAGAAAAARWRCGAYREVSALNSPADVVNAFVRLMPPEARRCFWPLANAPLNARRSATGPVRPQRSATVCGVRGGSLNSAGGAGAAGRLGDGDQRLRLRLDQANSSAGRREIAGAGSGGGGGGGGGSGMREAIRCSCL